MKYIYYVMISPLEYLIEMVFELMFRLFGNMMLSLLFMSIAVSLMALPLYINAEKLQNRERAGQKAMEKWSGHIKKSFKGDERMMILSFYYRTVGYSPLSIFKGLIPLFLQALFFIAAYNNLSKSELLAGSVAEGIGNLGEADCMISISGRSIHLLPVIMTVINCISGAVYTKGQGIREKIQVYLPALVFLVLLYPSPSGLVIYWIFNNLFSLLKNLYFRLDDEKKKKAAVIPAAVGGLLVIWSLMSGRMLGFIFSGKYVMAAAMAALEFMFFIPLIRSGRKKAVQDTVGKEHKTDVIQSLMLPAILASVFMGIVVPLKLIAASPLEFVNIFAYSSPFAYVVKCACTAFGAFTVWGSIIWGLQDAGGKRRTVFVMELIAVAFVIDYIVFGAVEGRVSASLVFDEIPKYDITDMVLNLLLIAAGTAGSCFLGSRLKIKNTVYALVICAVMIISLTDAVGIHKGLKTLPVGGDMGDALEILPLSREGRNVIVFMLDRAISGYVPYIFEEKPELKEKFTGFCWYPNTVSYGGATIFGMPSLFGGYDYTPEAINARTDKTVAADIDEALKVMPVRFGEAGWGVTVCDPSYAGFSELPDVSIYDDMPYVSAYRIRGRYSAGQGDNGSANELTARNIVYYSLMEVLPQCMRKLIYDNGRYLYEGKAGSLNAAFVDSYREMDNLPEMTSIRDSGDSFIMITNNLTHSPQMLKRPGYEPAEEELESADVHTAGSLYLDTSMYLGEDHYDVNMAAFIKLAEWFDMLRAEGVYDNSRIILVADHGYSLGQFEELRVNEELDVQAYNPLLMVKDFNAEGFEISYDFMTNADTPAIAMEDLIADPVNPFSGNVIDMSGKYPYVSITLSEEISLSENMGNTLNTDASPWYRVHDDIFDKNAWEREE